MRRKWNYRQRRYLVLWTGVGLFLFVLCPFRLFLLLLAVSLVLISFPCGRC